MYIALAHILDGKKVFIAKLFLWSIQLLRDTPGISLT